MIVVNNLNIEYVLILFDFNETPHNLCELSNIVLLRSLENRNVTFHMKLFPITYTHIACRLHHFNRSVLPTARNKKCVTDFYQEF